MYEIFILCILKNEIVKNNFYSLYQSFDSIPMSFPIYSSASTYIWRELLPNTLIQIEFNPMFYSQATKFLITQLTKFQQCSPSNLASPSSTRIQYIYI